jgi:hypothetical protein
MKALSLQLEPYQQLTLEWMRDRHPVPYLREKAAALLKIAEGQKVEEVARSGLLKPRKADTVRGWLKDYQRHGLGALYQRPRRGRIFPPGASR